MQFNLSPSDSQLESIQNQLEQEEYLGIRDIWVCINPYYFGMEENNKLIGVASMILGSEACELYKLYVPCSHRGKGIASSLVKKAVEISKNNGAHELYVEISGNSSGFWKKITKDLDTEFISNEKFIIKL